MSINFDDVWEFLTTHELSEDEWKDIKELCEEPLKPKYEDDITPFTFVEEGKE